MAPEQPQYTFVDKALAWSVHLFTSCGIVVGLLAIIAISQQDWRMAMIWMFVTLVIDGIDGTFARKFRVKEVLPQIDGKTIDYVIDFTTYAVIPAYFIYASNLVPAQFALPTAALILLISAVYYGKEGMVSDDMYFVGFPVMWNMVALYLFFVIHLDPWVNLGLIVLLGILHFVPIKFVYPSRTPFLMPINIIAIAANFIANFFIVYLYPKTSYILWSISVATIAYFTGLSIYVTYIKKE